MVYVDGNRISLSEACRRLGLNYKTIQSRLYAQGLTPQEAIDRPIMTNCERLFVRLNGERVCVKEACRRLRLCHETVYRRIREDDYAPEKAIKEARDPKTSRGSPGSPRKTKRWKIKIEGTVYSLTGACRHKGIAVSTVCKRLKNGWTIQQALTKKVDKSRATNKG